METIKQNKYYIAVGFVGLAFIISAGVLLYQYEIKKQPVVQNIETTEMAKIIEDLKTLGVPLTTEQKKEVANDFKKTSKPLSDVEKTRMLQDLQNLTKY